MSTLKINELKNTMAKSKPKKTGTAFAQCRSHSFYSTLFI